MGKVGETATESPGLGAGASPAPREPYRPKARPRNSWRKDDDLQLRNKKNWLKFKPFLTFGFWMILVYYGVLRIKSTGQIKCPSLLQGGCCRSGSCSIFFATPKEVSLVGCRWWFWRCYNIFFRKSQGNSCLRTLGVVASSVPIALLAGVQDAFFNHLLLSRSTRLCRRCRLRSGSIECPFFLWPHHRSTLL